MASVDEDICSSLHGVEIMYYDRNKRKWHPGDMFLSSDCFLIICDNLPEKYLKIKYHDCDQIQKANSSFVFKCVVIWCCKCDHWISSNENRDFLFSTCEHFWRESLFRKGKLVTQAKDRPIDEGTSGDNILRLVRDSEATLSDAAVDLHEQGLQLEDTLIASRMIENDLGVSERIIRHIKSPFSTLLKGSASSADEMASAPGKRSSSEQTFSYNVMFSEGRAVSKNVRQGSLHISKHCVVLLDEKENVVRKFMKNCISGFEIMSPWTFVITKCMIGECNVNFRIYAARLAELLKVLEPHYRERINYHSEDDDSFKHLRKTRLMKMSSNAGIV